MTDAVTKMDGRGRSLRWDALGRLRAVVDDQGTTVATYTYDSGRRRVAKDVGGTVTEYALSGWQVLAEYDGATTLTREFVYGRGIDEPVAMNVNLDGDGWTTGAQDAAYYYSQDMLGSVAAVTDAAGTITETYDYAPYGMPVVVDATGTTRTLAGASAVGNPYLFTGRRWEPEIGFYFYRNRYYDPLTGRFLSQDPLGYVDGMNLYQYVMGMPGSHTDPLGLEYAPYSSTKYLIYNPNSSTDSERKRLSEKFGLSENTIDGIWSIQNRAWSHKQFREILKSPGNPYINPAAQQTNLNNHNNNKTNKDINNLNKVPEVAETVVRTLNDAADVAMTLQEAGEKWEKGDKLGFCEDLGWAAATALPLFSSSMVRESRKLDNFPKDYVTRNTKNWSSMMNSERDARNLALNKLGKNPVEIEPNKWRSADGKWQYRSKPGDLADHHIHLEELDPETGEVLQNVHLRWNQE